MTIIQNRYNALFGAAVLSIAIWLIHGYLGAIAWAGIVALASWPLYRKFIAHLPAKAKRWAPLLFTLLVTLLFLVPLGYILIVIGHEASLLAGALVEAQTRGLPPPSWVGRIPFAGESILAWWNKVLSTPGGFSIWFHQVGQGPALDWLRFFGVEIVHRSIVLALTLLALYFLYRDGETLAMRLLSLTEKVLGTPGKRHASRAVDTIRGTVNGLILVGIAEGLLLGLAYALAGLPSPALWGALTGLLAIIPFGMPALFGTASLILLAQGNQSAALLILIWGTLVMLVSDHVVRPMLIGDSAELPLIWIILGILGGIETFGLLGLFLGPVIMATMVSLWREWTNVRDHPV
ncbi:MAG: AI-2E family transporter [Burkholderiales bacterium]|nr:AI-2E family transporter [Burkholderiales bacterium]